MSVVQIYIWFSSARNNILLNPSRKHTPEYTLSTGISVRFSSATHLYFCLPSYLISNIRRTLIFLYTGGGGILFFP